MNENQLKITPEFILEMVIRRRWLILIPFCLALIGGIYYSIVTPRIYESKTLILVEGQRVPENYVRSIVTDETSARINTISQQILSRTNLEQIMQEFSLFTGPKYANLYTEDKVTRLRENISVNVVSDRRRQAEAFEISFKGQDPEKVMQVANGLAGSFIDENLKVRESQAIGTSTFLDSELSAMRARLEQVEENIKNFRKANMGELPEQLETNLRILERLQDNMSDRKQSVREAKLLLAELRKQATSQQPSVVVIGGDQRPPEGGATLAELSAELEALQSRYTSKHPDIIRLKKQIAEMATRQASGIGSDETVPSMRIPPEIRAQIIDTQRELRLAENEIKSLEAQIAVYQKRIENTPKKEQELLSLKRDYTNIQASYDSLLNRKLEADIAVNMERKQKGEQFRIVDHARLPKRPIEPDLKKIFLMVVAAGLGLGGGLAFLLEFLNTSFRKPDDVENAYGLPVLVSVPIIYNARQKLYRKIDFVGSIATSLFAAGLFGIFAIICLINAEPFISAVNKVMQPRQFAKARQDRTMGKIFDALGKATNPSTGTAKPTLKKKTGKNSRAQAKTKDNVVPFATSTQQASGDRFDENLITFHQPQSVEAEIFKVLRTNLLFPLEGKPPKSILVTSALPGDGKSFVAANLAISIAQGIEEHVLLMDADIRKPSLDQMFGMGMAVGLSEYLAKGLDVADHLVKTAVDKLTILPAGNPPHNPTELLSTQKMKALLDELKNRYDDRYLIIDSAPPSFSPGTAAIANYMDGILIVVKAGKTPKKAIDEVIEQLGKEKILGIVLNYSDKAAKKYYGYGKSYYQTK